MVKKSFSDIEIDKKCYEKWGLSDFCPDCPLIKAKQTKKIDKVEVEKADDKTWEMKVIPEINEEGEIEGFIEIVFNITEKKKLEEVRNLLKNLVNQAPGATFQYQLFPDGSSAFPYASKGIKEIYEYNHEEVREDASKTFQRIHPDDYEKVVNSIQESAENLTVWQEEYRLILPQKGLIWVEGNARPEKLPDGSVLWHGNINDISKRKNKEKKLEELSLYDPNSGMPNSSNLIKTVDELIDEERKRENIYLVVLDVENYEEIMKAIGHTRWGGFLNEVATQLKERLEIKFILNDKQVQNGNIKIKSYNIYHNKLGFLLMNVSENRLSEVLLMIKSNTEQPFYCNKIPVFLDPHLGVASHKTGDSGADLLQNAYQAMNTAVKEKKKIQFYNETLKEKNRESFELLGEIKNALADDQFELHYMPKVKLSSDLIWLFIVRNFLFIVLPPVLKSVLLPILYNRQYQSNQTRFLDSSIVYKKWLDNIFWHQYL